MSNFYVLPEKHTKTMRQGNNTEWRMLINANVRLSHINQNLHHHNNQLQCAIDLAREDLIAEQRRRHLLEGKDGQLIECFEFKLIKRIIIPFGRKSSLLRPNVTDNAKHVKEVNK